MTPTQVRQILGEPDRTFKKTSADALETDAFDTVGIHIFYKLSGMCEAIELASPANPTFQGKSLLGQPFSRLREWFQSIDPTTETDETGLTSPQFGIGLYAPFAIEAPDEAVEGVIIFEQGYYES